MKSEFRNENFEEFLKRNADNLRMKAPEKIWQNITGELKKSRRRFGAGLSAFFILASLLAYLTISNTARQVRVTDIPVPAELQLPDADEPAVGPRGADEMANA